MIRVALLALWMVLMLSGHIAQAQVPVVIVVPHVDAPDYSAYERRLRSELIAAGFQPVSVEIPGDIESQLLRRTALRLTSSAAISISIQDGLVRGLVWIQGRGRSGDSLRPVADYPTAEQAPTVFAVRATDVLHGALLEMGYVESPAPEAPAPLQRSDAPEHPPEQAKVPVDKSPAPTDADSAPTPTTVPPSEVGLSPEPEPVRTRVLDRTWDIRGLGQLGVPFDAFPIGYGLTLTGLRRLGHDWRVGISGSYFAPVTSRSLPNQGRASITQAFAGTRIEYLHELTVDVAAQVFAELGLHAVAVAGTAAAPYAARSPYWLTGYSSIGLGSSWKLTSHFGLFGETGLLWPWRSSDVIVVRTVVGKAAGPTLLTAAGVQFSL